MCSARSGPEWPTDGTAQFTVTLRNDSAVATAEVVQVYLQDPDGYWIEINDDKF